MRRQKRKPNIVGIIAIALGIIILLSLVLPPSFWWFMLGVGLIVFGICSKRWFC